MPHCKRKYALYHPAVCLNISTDHKQLRLSTENKCAAICQHSIRPTAIGKKNWLFIGEAAAGQTSAILFTLIEACRRRQIDLWEYLRDMLTLLPGMTNRQIEAVMPDAWAKARDTTGPAPLRTPSCGRHRVLLVTTDTVYLRDGRVQIDNNLIENALRPSAVGKKDWLFMGDAKSGDRAATFYTLVGNCHREGINAEAYLTDLFTRLPTETNQTVHRLTPKAWAAEQRSLHQAQAKNCVATA